MIKSFETKPAAEEDEEQEASPDEEGKYLTAKEGANLFVWDMRYPDAVSFDGLILYSSNTKGPLAVPGDYRARLNFNGRSVEQEFEILVDPRVSSSPADLQAQFDFLIKVRDKLSEANQTVIDIRKMYADFDYLEAKLEDQPDSAQVLEAIAAMREQASVIENNLHETRSEAYQDPLNFGIKLNNRLSYLATHESAGDFRPTDQGEAYRQEVSAQIDQEIAAFEQLVEGGLSEINLMLRLQEVELLSAP